jgi:diguanylate cyclase (GGDEF)-like protein/PAS domain S-box-containing protein
MAQQRGDDLTQILAAPLVFWNSTRLTHAVVFAILLLVLVLAVIEVRRTNASIEQTRVGSSYLQSVSSEALRMLVDEREYLGHPDPHLLQAYEQNRALLQEDVARLSSTRFAEDNAAEPLRLVLVDRYARWAAASAALIYQRSTNDRLLPGTPKARAEYALFQNFQRSIWNLNDDIETRYNASTERLRNTFVIVIVAGLLGGLLLLADISITTQRARRSIKTQHEKLVRSFSELRTATAVAEQLASEKKLILETIDSGIVAVDPQGHITYTNRAAAKLFGTVEHTTLIGQQLEHLLEDAALNGRQTGSSESRPLFLALRRRQAVRNVEMQLNRINRIVEVSAAPMIDEIGYLSGAVANVTDITARKQLEERLLYLSRHDAQTGLINRAYMLERLSEALVTARKTLTQCAVVLVEVEEIKRLTYLLGHDVGDRLLAAIATRLQSLVADPDDVSRLSSDQFGIIVRDVRKVVDLSSYVRKIINDLRLPLAVADRKLFVSPMAGVSMATAEAPGADTLLHYADSALQHAKLSGNREPVHYTAQLLEETLRHLTLESDLRAAIERGEFYLAYQPIVSTNGHGICGFEALARWNHPELGTISPSVFIPLSENTGAMAELGPALLRRAIEESADALQNVPDVTVAINVSTQILQGGTLLPDLTELLSRNNFSPDRLILEVTETAFASNLETVATHLNMARELGIKVAIDDFGTGYGSFTYLRNFAPDVVKVDMKFIQKGPLERESDAICKAIVELGRTLEMEVVAEGIEEPAHAEYATSIGCDAMQGDLFGRAHRDAMLQFAKQFNTDDGLF